MAKDKLLFCVARSYPSQTSNTNTCNYSSRIMGCHINNYKAKILKLLFPGDGLCSSDFYGFTTIAFFKFRKENAGKDNGFKLFGYPYPIALSSRYNFIGIVKSFYGLKLSQVFIVSGYLFTIYSKINL